MSLLGLRQWSIPQPSLHADLLPQCRLDPLDRPYYTHTLQNFGQLVSILPVAAHNATQVDVLQHRVAPRQRRLDLVQTRHAEKEKK